MKTLPTDKIFAKPDTIVSRSIAGETILVPIRGELADMEKIFSLEEVGEFIWQQIDGKQSLSDICDLIMGTFDVKRDAAEVDLLEFITELERSGLIAEEQQ